MGEMRNIIKTAKKFVLEEIKKYGAPYPIHFEISNRKALELAENLQADKAIVQIGVYLMDVKLGQAFTEGKLDRHVEMSVEASKKFLAKFDISKSGKAKIINCVEAHHGTVPYTCLEAEICANADCYRFLHPKGFLAFVHMLGKRKDSFEEDLRYAKEKLEEKYKVISLDICKKEADEYYRLLKNLINLAKRPL